MTSTYTYDAFGPVRAHTGASTEWSYTGEQNDPNGLEYLRARYYDPAIGRFLSRDPWPGSVFSPQSLNPYAYVLNNPCNLIDPWGLQYAGTCRPPTPGFSAPPLVGEKPGVTPTPTAISLPRPTGTPTPTAADPCAPLPYIAGNDFALFPAIKQLLVKSSGWFNNTCPGNITRVFGGITVSAVGMAGAVGGQEYLAPLVPVGWNIAFGGPPGQPPFEACR